MLYPLTPCSTSLQIAELQTIEDALKKSGGPFIMGADFTAADIAVMPFISQALIATSTYAVCAHL
jgi:glutathione S-transferase